MYKQTLFLVLKKFVDIKALSRSVSTQKATKYGKLTLPAPEFDWEYLTNPANRAEILENIKIRRSEGDIDRVIELNEQVKLEGDASKRESLVKELINEAKQIPNQSHPDIKAYNDTPKAIKTAMHLRPEGKGREALELGTALRMIKTDNLTTVTGPRSYYFLSDVAELEQALIKFTLNKLMPKKFQLVSVPDILPPEVIEGCGMATTGHRSQVFFLEDVHGKNLCLSGTSEMALGGLVSNKLYDAHELPILMTSCSRCYRAEVGNLGVEHGIFRVHSFTKIEMFGITRQDQSKAVTQQFVDIEEDLLKSLELDYQILDMPLNDLGAQAYRKFDIEAWLPGQKRYGEISSTSDCTSYQARRLNIKYKDGDNVYYAHTVNGTACAVPRMIIALMETHQQSNGNVLIPEPLQMSFNGREEIQPRSFLPSLTGNTKETRSGKK